MANGGGITFKFEQDNVQNILKRRGLESGGFVQPYVDSEVMRYMEDYMPRLSGHMIDQMIIPTVIGSGEVVVETPYARLRSKIAKSPPESSGPNRGPHFFERMKADHADDILNGAAKLSGGKAEK